MKLTFLLEINMKTKYTRLRIILNIAFISIGLSACNSGNAHIGTPLVAQEQGSVAGAILLDNKFGFDNGYWPVEFIPTEYHVASGQPWNAGLNYNRSSAGITYDFQAGRGSCVLQPGNGSCTELAREFNSFTDDVYPVGPKGLKTPLWLNFYMIGDLYLGGSKVLGKVAIGQEGTENIWFFGAELGYRPKDRDYDLLLWTENGIYEITSNSNMRFTISRLSGSIDPTIYDQRSYIVLTHNLYTANLGGIAGAQHICETDPNAGGNQSAFSNRRWKPFLVGGNNHPTIPGHTYYNQDNDIIATATTDFLVTGPGISGEKIMPLEHPISTSYLRWTYWTGLGVTRTAYDWTSDATNVAAQTGDGQSVGKSWAEYAWKPANEMHNIACVTEAVDGM